LSLDTFFVELSYPKPELVLPEIPPYCRAGPIHTQTFEDIMESGEMKVGYVPTILPRTAATMRNDSGTL